MASDLALVNLTLGRCVDKLNRVFQRQDVALAGHVQVLYQRSQGGAFTAASGAGDQDQPAGGVQPGHDGRGHLQLRQIGHLVRQQPQDQTRAMQMLKGIDPAAAMGRQVQGEVCVGAGVCDASALQSLTAQGVRLIG